LTSLDPHGITLNRETQSAFMKPSKISLPNLVYAIYEDVWYFRPEAKKKMIAKIRADRARRFIRSQIKWRGIKVTTSLVEKVATGLKIRYKKRRGLQKK